MSLCYVQVRQYAAVLLRRKVMKRRQWLSLTDEVRSGYVSTEPSPSPTFHPPFLSCFPCTMSLSKMCCYYFRLKSGLFEILVVESQ